MQKICRLRIKRKILRYKLFRITSTWNINLTDAHITKLIERLIVWYTCREKKTL